jgi:hypothetical protein
LTFSILFVARTITFAWKRRFTPHINLKATCAISLHHDGLAPDDVGYDTVTNSIGLTVAAGMLWGVLPEDLPEVRCLSQPNFRKILRKLHAGPLSDRLPMLFLRMTLKRLILASL